MELKDQAKRFVYMVFLVVTPGVILSQVNLLSNPGLESWSGDSPASWDRRGSSYIGRENGIKQSGSASARFTIPTTSTTVELSQDVSVTAGIAYTFQCGIQDNTTGGQAGLLVNWRNASGSISTTTSSRSSDTGGWQQIDISNAQAPPTATIARVRIRGYKQGGSGGGNVYIDDAIFYDDASLPVVLSSLSAVQKNRLILISWITESESQCRGFHVLRSIDENNGYNRITTVLIPCEGNGSSGSEYKYVDENIERDCDYWYKIEVINNDGTIQELGPVSAVPEIGTVIPDAFRLFFNYPNPFNPTTSICYYVSEESVPYCTSLKIYNSLGREIMTLVDRIHDAGVFAIDWNGCDVLGKELPSGIYFCQLSSGGQIIETKRMVKMR